MDFSYLGFVLLLSLSSANSSSFALKYFFLLRFGLANANDTYFRLKIRVVCREFFTLKCI